jgi:hypothetical protein
VTTTRSFPRPTLRRSAIVPLLVLVALVGGPLGFAPAQAATSTVSGVVLDSTGAPVEEAWIGVYQRDDEDETYYVDDSAETFTDESGHYALELAPGTYKFFVEGDRQHVSEFYNDAERLSGATAVVVGDSAVTLDDVELELLPSVQGTVTSDAGAAVTSAYVLAFQHVEGEGWDAVDEAYVDRSGHYALPLETGTYRIGFFDEDDEYVPEFWKDATGIERGTDVVVGSAGAAGIDARLTPQPVRSLGRAVNATRPMVQGFAAVNQVLESNDGMWKTDPVTIQDPVVTTRQWLRNGVPIPGAVGDRYRALPSDVGSTLSVRVTGSGHRLQTQAIDSGATGVVKWTSTTTATSRPGRKKATLTIRPRSNGGTVTGTVTIKLRYKKIKTVRLRNGKAVVKLRLKRKQKYDLFYNGSPTVHASRAPLFVRIK